MTLCKSKYRIISRVNIYTSFWCEVDVDIDTVLKVVLYVIVALRYRSRKKNLYPYIYPVILLPILAVHEIHFKHQALAKREASIAL